MWRQSGRTANTRLTTGSTIEKFLYTHAYTTLTNMVAMDIRVSELCWSVVNN